MRYGTSWKHAIRFLPRKNKGCAVRRHRGRVVTFRIRFWSGEVNKPDFFASQMFEHRVWMHFSAKGAGSGEEDGCEGTAPLRLWVN